MAPAPDWSKTWTFYKGDWHEGNIPIMGVRSHAAWLCSSVFDGARTFEGVSPDLDLHCARINASATRPTGLSANDSFRHMGQITGNRMTGSVVILAPLLVRYDAILLVDISPGD